MSNPRRIDSSSSSTSTKGQCAKVSEELATAYGVFKKVFEADQLNKTKRTVLLEAAIHLFMWVSEGFGTARAKHDAASSSKESRQDELQSSFVQFNAIFKIQNSLLDKITTLIQSGASFKDSKGKSFSERKNKQGLTLLFLAIESQHIEAVKSLIENKFFKIDEVDSEGNTPLHIAFHMMDLPMIRYLMEQEGASLENKNINGYTPSNYVDYQKRSLLQLAALNEHVEFAEFLLNECKVKHEKDPNGFTPFEAALNLSNNMTIVQWLFLNQYVSEEYLRDIVKSKSNVLYDFCRSGDVAFIKALIRCGANMGAVETENRKSTPLHNTADSNHVAVMEVLIAAGADINAQDSDGNTPSHIALENKHKEAARVLIATGKIRWDIKNKNGKTALEMASKLELVDAKGILLKTKKVDLAESKEINVREEKISSHLKQYNLGNFSYVDDKRDMAENGFKHCGAFHMKIKLHFAARYPNSTGEFVLYCSLLNMRLKNESREHKEVRRALEKDLKSYPAQLPFVPIGSMKPSYRIIGGKRVLYNLGDYILVENFSDYRKLNFCTKGMSDPVGCLDLSFVERLFLIKDQLDPETLNSSNHVWMKTEKVKDHWEKLHIQIFDQAFPHYRAALADLKKEQFVFTKCSEDDFMKFFAKFATKLCAVFPNLGKGYSVDPSPKSMDAKSIEQMMVSEWNALKTKAEKSSSKKEKTSQNSLMLFGSPSEKKEESGKCMNASSSSSASSYQPGKK